jgi:hypothetical protein
VQKRSGTTMRPRVLPCGLYMGFLALEAQLGSASLLLYKLRRLWRCVSAHSVTNLLLGVHVLVTQAWQ